MRVVFTLALAAGLAAAETGIDAWLRYAPLPSGLSANHTLPSAIVALNSTTSSPVYTAGQELRKGLKGIFGRDIEVSHENSNATSVSAVVVGTIAAHGNSSNGTHLPKLEEDGFWLSVKGRSVRIVGSNERGALYGTFEYLSRLAQGNLSDTTYVSNPSVPLRWANEWDNLDGSIERGYGGPSIFFENNKTVTNVTRPAQYARLLSSIGINTLVVNNVNTNPEILSVENVRRLGKMADAFRPYGVRLGISMNFASPEKVGGLNTSDPLNPGVIAFWKNVTARVYHNVPDLAGYLIKADSEGQPGPLMYNRTLAQGANMFADAVRPFGGVVMYRAFVYDHNLNESDWYADRANAAVDYFKELDGDFRENVVVQIKYGPIDFQVREPASPLFANLRKTNTALELQITQEYMGEQIHLVYLPPLWKTVTDFDLRVDGQESRVRDIVSGQRFDRPLGGWAGVINVGTNQTWLGSHLAMSNLYAFGRLAWNPTLGSEAVLQDWTRLTFGLDEQVRDVITEMSMLSWPAYENHTGNLGVQTLSDILYTRFGPNPAAQDDNGWGQWTRADATGIGMDRTVGNGTKNAGQYPPEVAKRFEEVETTPEELLLWFHHLNYTHRLSSNKTIIQHFYDCHYSGAETVHRFPGLWQKLKDKVDKQRFEEVLFRLVFQAGHSIVWRDDINEFYFNKSGIPDELGRVGNHTWRIEAENMRLTGYRPTGVVPREAASNFTAVVAVANGTAATAEAEVGFPSGTYDVAVAYYDLKGGRARWKAYLGDRLLGQWLGANEDTLGYQPSYNIDGATATRITFRDVEVKEGDIIRVVGEADGNEPAPLDYVVFLPEGVID